MSEHTLSTPALSRRAAVAGAGAAALVGLGPTLGWAAPLRRRPVVGVLTPSVPGRSVVAARGDSLVAGLRVGLGGATRLLREDVPFSLHGVAEAAERLVTQGATVVVSALSDPVSVRLQERLAERGAALVVANAGAHVVADGAQRRPGALHNSMQHWAAALSLGQWAARNLGPRLHAVVAAPDAGYDSVFALRRGFAGAGGAVVGLSLTHTDGGIGDVVAEVRGSGADVIGVSASGTRAVAIVRALREGGVRAPILVDPSVLDASLSELRRARRVYVATASVDERALAGLEARLPGRADAHAVLGHDTGILVAAGLDRLRGRSPARLAATLAGARIAGVRGQMRVHARLGTVSTPLEVRKVASSQGGPASRVVVRRARIGGVAPAMSVVTGRESSGYLNEYGTT